MGGESAELVPDDIKKIRTRMPERNIDEKTEMIRSEEPEDQDREAIGHEPERMEK